MQRVEKTTYKAASILAAICVAAMAAGQAAADELRLKNGDRMSGQLTSLTPSIITYKTDYAATLQVEPVRVARLRTTGPVTILLNNGDRVSGTITDLSNGTLSLRSNRFGRLTLSLQEVAEVSASPGALDTATGGSLAAGSGTPQQISAAAPPPVLGPPGQPAGQVSSGSRVMAVQGRGARTGRTQVAQEAGQENQGTQSRQEGQQTQQQPVGQEQRGEEERERVFLRQTTVLLAPGQFELDANLSYLRNQRQGAADAIQRQALLTPTLRAGLLEGLEGFISVPFGWTQQQLSFNNMPPGSTQIGPLVTLSNDSFGVADLSFGLKYLIVAENESWPDIIASVTAVAPTAEAQNPFRTFPARLGSGRWLLGGELNFVRSYDPAVLYGGFGYTHVVDGNFDNQIVSGGDIYNYNLGLGFAINDQITLSGQFLGAYVTEIERGGEAVNPAREPMSLRSAITYRFATGEYIEPSITYGLNQDAVNVILDLSFIKKF